MINNRAKRGRRGHVESRQQAAGSGPWHIRDILPQVLGPILSRSEERPWGLGWNATHAGELELTVASPS